MRDTTGLVAPLADIEPPYVERRSSANDDERIRLAIRAFADVPRGIPSGGRSLGHAPGPPAPGSALAPGP